MSIHAGDRATMQNISWEDIRVEDARMNPAEQTDNLVIDLWVGTAVWTQDAEKGKIQNVHFKNINVLGGKVPRCRINGFDASHRVTGVTIDNLTILGKPVRTLADGGFLVNAFMDPPTFTYDLVGTISKRNPRADPVLPVLQLVPGTTSTILYRRPADHPAMIYNASGRLAPLDTRPSMRLP
jgi:hypothetical protein